MQKCAHFCNSDDLCAQEHKWQAVMITKPLAFYLWKGLNFLQFLLLHKAGHDLVFLPGNLQATNLVGNGEHNVKKSWPTKNVTVLRAQKTHTYYAPLSCELRFFVHIYIVAKCSRNWKEQKFNSLQGTQTNWGLGFFQNQTQSAPPLPKSWILHSVLDMLGSTSETKIGLFVCNFLTSMTSNGNSALDSISFKKRKRTILICQLDCFCTSCILVAGLERNAESFEVEKRESPESPPPPAPVDSEKPMTNVPGRLPEGQVNLFLNVSVMVTKGNLNKSFLFCIYFLPQEITYLHYFKLG